LYLKYYHFKLKPFEISPDPKFLWLGEKHKEGLATLRYGILTGKGFMSLTGDVGTGKTTLINALANSFDDNFIIARIPDPSLEVLDFFNVAANAFAMGKMFRSKGDFLSELSIFLNKAHADNKEVILIVDEAQRLKQELLEEIRLISNIEKPEKKLINIIFAGQNDFNFILNSNRALRNRLAINYQIAPLTENDAEEYIMHRLKIAGSKRRIFSTSAIHEIYSYSKGNPRQTNIICDLALVHGYAAETKNIEPAIIKECVERTFITFNKPEPLAEYPKIQAQVPIELNQDLPSGDLSRSWTKAFHRFKSTFSRPIAIYVAPVPLIIIVSLMGLMS
jgi:general secretion pathway protein A